MTDDRFITRGAGGPPEQKMSVAINGKQCCPYCVRELDVETVEIERGGNTFTREQGTCPVCARVWGHDVAVKISCRRRK